MGFLTISNLIWSLFILALIYLAYQDARTFCLPNRITFPLIIIGITLNSFDNTRLVSFPDALAGAVFGYLFFWVLNFLYRLIKKQDAIGMGDAKLLAALGAWLGLNSLPEVILIAALTGSVGGFIWLKIQNQDHRAHFPFGPFLAFAGIIELLWPHFLQAFILINLS
jgi:leader peptidase (prepilin peptidase) / N-methyltransferase